MLRGNQHNGREYDDLQIWLDMTSHENPLFHHSPLRGLPYLAYDNVNPAMVNSMMLRRRYDLVATGS